MQKAIDCAVLLFGVTMISTPGSFVIFELVCVLVSFISGTDICRAIMKLEK